MLKAMMLLGMLGIGGYVWWDPGFIGLTVSRVEFEGLEMLTADVFDSLRSAFEGSAMSVETCSEIERCARGIPLVDSAEARRSGLTAITVSVRETRILARIEGEQRLVIDSNGHAHPGVRPIDPLLPVIEGWSEDSSSWLSVLSLMARLSNGGVKILNGAKITGPPQGMTVRVKVTTPQDLEILLPCPADPRLEDRIDYLETVLADMRSRGEHPTCADLRWSNQIVVHPAGTESVS